MARVLIERETIYAEEVDMLIEGKSYAEVLKYMDEQGEKSADNRFKKFENENDSDIKPEEKSKEEKKEEDSDGGKNIRF